MVNALCQLYIRCFRILIDLLGLILNRLNSSFLKHNLLIEILEELV